MNDQLIPILNEREEKKVYPFLNKIFQKICKTSSEHGLSRQLRKGDETLSIKEKHKCASKIAIFYNNQYAL